jgi:hypothetical protein
MSLIKRPELTPKALAARRRNAQRSTGPRTPRGKARASLNAFKHGRRAACLRRFMRRDLRLNPSPFLRMRAMMRGMGAFDPLTVVFEAWVRRHGEHKPVRRNGGKRYERSCDVL